MSTARSSTDASEEERPSLELRRHFLPHVHAFRGLAIIAVVAAHVRFLFEWPAQDSAYTYALRSVIEGGTVLFVFIGGFLFRRECARFRYGEFLTRKWRRVIVPYLVCSLPALAHAFVFRYGVFEQRDDTPVWELMARVGHALLTAGHMFIPFWFIPAIAVVYLVSPALVAFERRPRLYGLVPVLLLIASFMHLSYLYLDVLHDAANLIPVYLLGMWVAHHDARAQVAFYRARHLLLSLVVALVLLDILLDQGGRLTSRAPFSVENGMFDATLIQKVFLSLWLYGVLAHFAATRPAFASGLLYRVLARLADTSFGIFFLHMYLIDFVLKPILRRTISIPHVTIPRLVISTVLVVALTTALVLLIKRVAGKRSVHLIGA